MNKRHKQTTPSGFKLKSFSRPPTYSISSSPSTMKTLYRKGTVHPSPPIISGQLSFLPATILTLTATLSPQDIEVLAYLISYQRKNNTTQKTARDAPLTKSKSNSNDHPPLFSCDCFRCYMSYWVWWDASPNRQLIHEIIDAFEDELLRNNKKVIKSNKKDKKKKGGGCKYKYNNDNSCELQRQLSSLGKEQSAESESLDGAKGFDHEDNRCLVKSFLRFIGEKIWGVRG
ncbi:uncharacterized protein LOC123193667 [Mangifera indica]|uniref:uncharacterized protein LOC123193667 n=1 Tax=Mangifera indica TaxID=29780 RepID=UPI001CF9D2F4|nr:uncharacterized protein LOC123193667 [Mangifera indica]